jgi:uncharacterized protein (DUF3820 family)
MSDIEDEVKTEVKRPPSYTERLISNLCENLDDDWDIEPIIEQIRRFARQEAKKIKKNEEREIDSLYFGKYKNKKIADVAKFDRSYLVWLRRQSFIKPNLQTALDKVLKPE